MLRELIGERIAFKDTMSNWEEAIKVAAGPLLEEREKAQKVQNQTSEEPANAPTSQIDDQTKEENNQTTPKEDKSQDSYVPFGNFVISKEETDEAQEIKNRVKYEENKPKERTFVDLNLDKLYDNEKQQTKRCLRCGGENDINADHCILCGEKFYDE